MKKLLLLLCLLPVLIQAQTGVTRHPFHFSGNGYPFSTSTSVFKNLNWGQTYIDKETGIIYEYQGSVRKWVRNDSIYPSGGVPCEPCVDGKDGRDGVDGAQGIQGLKGDKGDTGNCTGCPTGGGAMTGYKVWNPHLIEVAGTIYVQGVNNQTTVSQNGFTGIGYTSSQWAINNNDDYDWANLQYAIHLEMQSGKQIMLYGKFQIPASKMWDLGKMNYKLNIDGNFAEITSYGSGTGAVIGRPMPTDNGDANLMIQAMYDIKNITINATSGQTCFRPMPTYTSTFTHLQLNGGKVGMKLDFNLNAIVTSCTAFGNDTGFVAGYGKDWGGSTANSQSNHTAFHNCRALGGTNSTLGKVGFAAYASSGVGFHHSIVEWYGYERPFDIDWKGSTVTKTGGIYNTHVEGTLGNRGCASGDAFFFIRMVGTYTISESFQQYQGCLINASGGYGWLTLIVEKIPWLVVPANGKFLVNGGHTIWKFKDNATDEILPTTLASRFHIGAFTGGTGVATNQNTGGWFSGSDKYTIENGGWQAGIYPFVGSSSRELAPENPQYKLTLTIKPEAFNSMHQKLKPAAVGSHVWYFDNQVDAVKFANDNPDFNYTITQ